MAHILVDADEGRAQVIGVANGQPAGRFGQLNQDALSIRASEALGAAERRLTSADD
jgi:hypothetical protein